MHMLRADKRKSEDSMDKAKSLIRYIYEADGIVREAREREFKDRVKAVRGISEEIKNLGKELERYQEEAETDGDAIASAEDDICRHAPNIYGLR